MSKLPQISGWELSKALVKDGWVESGQKGSHRKFIKQLHPISKATVIVPQHKTIKKGTLGRILKDASLSVEKLKKLL